MVDDLLKFLIGIWLRYFLGRRHANQTIAAAARAPITLKDEIENVPASLWKAVALHLPCPGTLNVSLEVVRGSPVDVVLTTPELIDALERDGWNNIPVYTDFSALKTKSYRHSSQLDEGSYCLVIRDACLEPLSSSASDVSIKAQLSP